MIIANMNEDIESEIPFRQWFSYLNITSWEFDIYNSIKPSETCR